MFENLFEVALLLLIGLFLGYGLTWLYYKGIIHEYVEKVNEQQSLITKKNKENTNLYKDLKNKEDEIKKINTDIGNLRNIINEKDVTLSTLKTNISNLTLELSNSNQKKSSLEEKISQQIKQNQDLSQNAETEKTKNQTLETLITQKNEEIDKLKTDMKATQHDFTIIEGIGKKVSTILRLANINTFSKLGSTNVETINKILEAADPRILRLTNPQTWPEQAKLAAEKKWDDLKTLKTSLKSRKNS